MGLTINELESLAALPRLGEVLTIGRQNLFIHARERARLTTLGVDAASGVPFGTYVDDVLLVMGATTVTALDHSDYEGAELVHDLNKRLPSETEQKFDTVVDGGSLEHVFNVPVALANLMRAVAIDGHLMLSLPANNLCGHGFYQFSPELMFRVFSETAGFAKPAVTLVESRYPGIELAPAVRAYRVNDPASAGERVGLLGRRPVMMVAVAQKLQHVDEPFAVTPQQSDYQARWGTGSRHGRGKRRLPDRVHRFLSGQRQRRRYSLSNRRFYRSEE